MRSFGHCKHLAAALALASACVLGVSFASNLRAQPPAAVNLIAEGRTISGVVNDADGKPAPNGTPVKLQRYQAEAGPQPKDPKNPTGDSSLGTPEPSMLQKGPGSANTIASTTTDSSGHFTFQNVKPGAYQVIAGTPRAAGKAMVTVEKDKDPAALTIQLKKAV